MKSLGKTDIVIFAIVILTLLASVILSITSPNYFTYTFTIEDGPIENASALMLFASSVLLVINSRRLKSPSKTAITFTLIYALMFFFVAGEEISWGQRIFNWETTEFFSENNYQNETNLHNLVIGDMHLATSIFAAPISLVILCYLCILPLLHGRFNALDRLITKMAIPVPRLSHGALALVASVVVGLISVGRNWEVYEFIFALLSFSIFLNPKNSLLRDQET